VRRRAGAGCAGVVILALDLDRMQLQPLRSNPSRTCSASADSEYQPDEEGDEQRRGEDDVGATEKSARKRTSPGSEDKSPAPGTSSVI